MRRAEVGQVVRHQGHVAEVIAIGEGRHVTLRVLGKGGCPSCGREPVVSMMEDSQLFQSVEPVPTVEV